MTFGTKDEQLLDRPHDDALVITTNIKAFDVRRVLVDTGSDVNIIFKNCLDRMSWEEPLMPNTTDLDGFSGNHLMSSGAVELTLTLGVKAKISKPTIFLVVDSPKFAYNALLGRPALNAFRAVVLTYYMKS